MYRYSIIFLSIFSMSYTSVSKNASYNVIISSIHECNENQNYHISVSELSVKIVNGEIVASGTFTTDMDLLKPVRADVIVEKKELAWIKLPCIKNVGSCTYKDLCQFGVSEDENCPANFLENGVPCRCPIAKGSYTILPSFTLPVRYYYKHNSSSIFTGKYWSKINIDHEGETLACYKIYFSIQDFSSENMIE